MNGRKDIKVMNDKELISELERRVKTIDAGRSFWKGEANRKNKDRKIWRALFIGSNLFSFCVFYMLGAFPWQ